MSIPTNSTLEEILGQSVRLTVLAADEIVVATEDEDWMVVNGIPVEFRAYFRKARGGHWIANNIFAWRKDGEGYNPMQPATANQSSKIYRACVELAESISESALLRGERFKVKREIQSVYDAISMKQEELDALKNRHQALLVEEANAS